MSHRNAQAKKRCMRHNTHVSDARRFGGCTCSPIRRNPQYPCAVDRLSSICSFAVSNSNERRDGFKECLGLSNGYSPSSMWLGDRSIEFDA